MDFQHAGTTTVTVTAHDAAANTAAWRSTWTSPWQPAHVRMAHSSSLDGLCGNGVAVAMQADPFR